MKKYLLPLSLLMILLALNFACDEELAEECKPDEICENKTVTVCCTEEVCTYSYGGKEYSDSELDDLIVDLGCTISSTEGYDVDIAAIEARLQDLVNEVRAEL